MNFSSRGSKVFFTETGVCLFAIAFLVSSCSAQGGGSLGLNLDPDTGASGSTVNVSLDIPSSLTSQGLDTGYTSLYRGLTYSLVWDLGGGTVPPDLETVRAASWTIIGSAHINSDGVLSGTATIPDANNGNHLIVAVYQDQSSDSPLTYWWEYYTVVSAGTLTQFLPASLVYLIIAVLGIVVAIALAVLLVRRQRARRHAT